VISPRTHREPVAQQNCPFFPSLPPPERTNVPILPTAFSRASPIILQVAFPFLPFLTPSDTFLWPETILSQGPSGFYLLNHPLSLSTSSFNLLWPFRLGVLATSLKHWQSGAQPFASQHCDRDPIPNEGSDTWGHHNVSEDPRPFFAL